MQKGLTRILIWLGIMAILTLLFMGIWLVACGGSQTTESLKWLQFLQTLGTFLLPPVLCAWWWDEHHQPIEWLHLNQTVPVRFYLMAVAIMICAIPGINLLADLNGRIVLPKSLDFIEQILRQQEEAAAVLTERFLKVDNIWGLLINLGLLALLPALSEELSFRGILQQILGNQRLAIWISAFIFSAIHMQFYGFVPRMLMGALFGYMFVWTGSLWVPVVMHFTNNSMAVLAYYFLPDTKSADTIGAGTTWWLGVISLIVVAVLIAITYRDLQGYVRRTRTQ